MNTPAMTRTPDRASATTPEPRMALNANACIDIDELRKHVPVLRRKLSAGQYLYRAGQPFGALFLVHAGFLKACLVAEDGREQVTGFRMRGDLLGVESIGAGSYSCDIVALDTSEVWELPYPAILNACALVSNLQDQLATALAAEIRRDHSWMLAMGTLNAEQRVAAFLLDLAARHAALGFSERHFVLRMSRADIGNFLALKHETVTRALTRLSGQGCIDVQWREVRLLDSARLRSTVSGVTSASIH